MAATIGNLFINLKANSAPLQAGLKKSQNAVSSFSSGMSKMRGGISRATKHMKLLALAAVAAGTAIVVKTMASIDEIAKMSKVLGMTTQEMREFAHITSLAGVESKFAQKSLLNLVRSTAEVANGTGSAKDAFAMMGINAKEMAKQTPLQMLDTLADGLENVTNQTDRVLVGYRLFGTRGIQMVNLLQEGSAALQQQREDFRAIGGVISDMAAGGVEQANDAMTRLKAFFTGVAQVAVVHLAPAITKLVDRMTAWIKSMGGAGVIGIKVFGAIAEAISVVLDMFHTLSIGVRTIITSVRWLASQWIYYFNEIMGEAIVSLIELLSDDWGKAARQAQNEIRAIALEMERAAETDFNDLLDESVMSGWGDQVRDFTGQLLKEMEAANQLEQSIDRTADAHRDLAGATAESTDQAMKFIEQLDKQLRTFGMTSEMAKLSELERAGVDPKFIDMARTRIKVLEAMRASAKQTAAVPSSSAVASTDPGAVSSNVQTAIGAATFAFEAKDKVQEQQLEEAEEQTSGIRQLVDLTKTVSSTLENVFGGVLQ